MDASKWSLTVRWYLFQYEVSNLVHFFPSLRFRFVRMLFNHVQDYSNKIVPPQLIILEDQSSIWLISTTNQMILLCATLFLLSLLWPVLLSLIYIRREGHVLDCSQMYSYLLATFSIPISPISHRSTQFSL